MNSKSCINTACTFIYLATASVVCYALHLHEYPAGIVSNIEEGSTVDKESLQLPVSAKQRLWIERLVRNHMQTLKSEEYVFFELSLNKSTNLGG